MASRQWTLESEGGAREGSPIPACIQTSEVKQVPFLQGFSGPSLLQRDPGRSQVGKVSRTSAGSPSGVNVERGDRSSALQRQHRHSGRLLTVLGASEKWLSQEEATPKEGLSEVQRLMS